MEHSFDLDRVAAAIVSVFPKLDPFEQRLSLELYRSLAEGKPVPRALLAERVGALVELVDPILNEWPGVFSDPQRNVVGYWGLSIPTAYAGPHTLKIDGRALSAWCAWDALFLPQLLDKRVDVESKCPAPVATIKLVVTPAGLESVQPADAHMSFLLPDTTGVEKDIVSTFCHFVHFFPSRQAGEAWAARHPGMFILSVAQAHGIAHGKNETQYRKSLR